MAKAFKNRASKLAYSSSNQLVLEGFETPFSQKLNPYNRWVILAHKIPWDMIAGVYRSQMNNHKTGADGINPRVAVGALFIKHFCNLSDREAVLQIQENMYMQYFIGYSSFSNEEPFDPSLFVDFRKRLGHEQINKLNEMILNLSHTDSKDQTDDNDSANSLSSDDTSKISDLPEESEPKGYLIVDATACPQDISSPTDLNLLNDAREKSEQIIDKLYRPSKHGLKPRTYRKIARKVYLKTAQKKLKTKNEIRSAIRKQLSFVKRNIKNIHLLLDAYDHIPLARSDYKYLLVIQTLYDQQAKMFKERTHSIDHRIVSIHQPHVRPIVRGKTNAYVEFGSKINVSIMNDYAFLDDLEWEAYNEGTRLISTVEKYKQRFGYYPKVVLADKIYCNRSNRSRLKELGIKLKAKPLGRPTAVSAEHVSPGERNPIEGKFGQGKTRYGMNRIKARLQQTSESWIATIILVLNLVKLTGRVPLWFLRKILTYSARTLVETGNFIFNNFAWLSQPKISTWST